MQMFSAVVCLGLILTSRQAVSFGLSDLSIGGFAWSADTTQARRALGAPQRARSYDSTGYDEEHLHLTHWTYPGLSLVFNRGRWIRIRLTGRPWSTHRGLRVGDPVERIEALYGPAQRHAAIWYYPVREGSDRRLGMYVETAGHRVTAIVIGQISDAT